MKYKVEFDSWYCPEKMAYKSRYWYTKDGEKVMVSKDDIKIERGQWIYEPNRKENHQN